MATEGGGKIKEKRSHPSVKPYERRKSILGKVTKTVKDLFVPSWLNEWVSKTPERSSEDGIVGDNPQRRDVQADQPMPGPSGVPLVVPFTSSQLPIPGARARPGTPRDDSRSVLSEASVQPLVDQGDYQQEVLQLNDTGLERLRETLEKEMDQTASFLPNTDPGLSPRSVAMVPGQPLATQPGMFGGVSQSRSKSYAALMSSSSSSSSSSSVRRGKPFTPAHHSRPSFNVSAFCSPSHGDQSLLGDTMFESSFYSGMTTYGGASAHRRRTAGPTTPYQTALPIRRQLKARPTQQAQGAVTSSTARKILETLERMSTPLSDARRIPTESANVDSVLNFTPSLPRRTSLRGSETPESGPPTRRLQVPGVASIAKNRQTFRWSSPLTASTPAPPSSALASSTAPAPPQSSSSMASVSREQSSERLARADTVPVDRLAGGGAGGKMRRERSNHHFKAAKPGDDELDVEEVPNFSTNFTLPVSGSAVPKIDFGFTSPAAASQPSRPSSGPSPGVTTSRSPASSGSSALASEGNGVPTLGFTFSSPISKSSPTQVGQAEVSSSPADFKFRSPVQAQGSRMAVDSTPPTSTVSMASLPEDKPRSTAPLVGNGGFALRGSLTWGKPVLPTSDSSFGKSGTAFSSLGTTAAASSSSQAASPMMFGAAKDLRSGSVMDVLGKKPSPAREEGLGGLKPAAELKSGSVMDILGKSSPAANKEEGGFRGVQPAAELKKGSVMDILGKGASSPSSAAGIQPAKSLEQGSVNDILGGKKDTRAGEDVFAKFKVAAGSWECGDCLVQNKPEASVCVACSAAKPGAKNATPQTTAAAAASAPASDSLFARLAKPAGSWECKECFVQNKSESSSCAACSTPKPGGAAPTSASSAAAPAPSDSLLAKFAKPAGTWECQACMVQNKAGEVKCVACSTAKPGAVAQEGKKNGASGSSGGSVGSLAGLFKRPAGDWDCKMCDVFNKSESVKCICCGTPRPGTEPSAALAKTVPASSFSFGNPTSSSSVVLNSGGGFSFSSSSANPTTTSSGFKFGSADSSGAKSGDSSQAPASSGFQFGASEQSKPLGSASALADKTAAPATSAGGFKFGADPQQSTTTSALPSGTPSFTFGQPKAVGLASSPAPLNSIGGIGESKTMQESSTSAASGPGGAGTMPGLFSFGQKPAETQGMTSSTSSPSGFSFGQKPQDSQPPPYSVATGGFNFGQRPPDTAKPSPSPALAGIVFGQKPTNSPPVTSASPAVPAAGGFSFGQKQPDAVPAASTTATSAGGFGFGAAAAAGVANKPLGQATSSAPLAGVGGSIGGFGSVSSVSNPLGNGASEDKAKGFSFGGVTSGQPALGGGALGEGKPAFGNFNFGASKAASLPAVPNVFNAGGSSNSSGPTAQAKPAFPALGNKRSHEEDANPPQAKKLFGNGPTEASAGFGSVPAESKFNFGTAGSAAAPSNNAFKMTANDGVFNPSSTPNFNFSGSTNSASVFQFGQPDSSSSGGGGQAPNSTPFSFSAQPPSAPSNFSFNPTQAQFTMGTAGQNSSGMVQQRQIKKAARRLKR